MAFPIASEQLLKLLPEASPEGNLPPQISGLADLKEAQSGDLSFLGNSKYSRFVETSKASVIIVPEDFEGSPASDQCWLRHPQPSLALAVLCRHIEKILLPPPVPGVHPTAFVHPKAAVDPSASIGPLCVIMEGAKVEKNAHLVAQIHLGSHSRVGSDSWLAANVVLGDYCVIGDRCRVHGGTVIGSDGYGYEFVNGKHEKVPQIGIVSIEDDVEIGANTAIDRARFGLTKIGAGTKIDNLVMIGHNVKVGKGCLIVAQAGISGSTTLGDYVVVGGQAGLAGHVTIGDRAKIGAQTGISKDLEPDAFVRGTPAFPYMEAQRIYALQRRLPEFFKRLKALEK